MTFDELKQAVLEILPDATLGWDDNDGQIVIYTNLTEGNGDELVPLTEKESLGGTRSRT